MNEQDATIVRAVAVASLSSQNKELGVRIQKTMARAVHFCSEKGYGVSEANTPILKHCMEAARQAVKNTFPQEADVDAACEAALIEVTRG